MANNSSTSTRFNSNYMKDVITAAYNKGNRTLIKDKDVTEAGLPSVVFDWHVAKVDALYDAAIAVARLRHDFSKDLDGKELAKRENKLFDLWKDMIGEVEPTTTSNVIRCNPADVDDIVSFCWKFVKDQNNVNDSKDFVAHQVFGDNTKRDFRKKVEIMLGNMAVAASQINSWKVRYLREESKLLNKLRSNKQKVTESEKVVAMLEADLNAQQNEETKKYIQTKLNNETNTLNTLRKNVKTFTNKLAAFHAEPEKFIDKVELMPGMPKPEPKAEEAKA